MTPGYPLTLDVTGRRVLVVGGGPVAARRARGLVDAGARVEVVAPAVCEDLADLIGCGAVRWTPREYAEGDLTGAWLVHTATGDPRTDAAVAAAAQARRVWCVRADDQDRSAAWVPAVARTTDATGRAVLVAVTGGGDPRRATAIRDAVAAQLQAGLLPLAAQRPRPAHSPDRPGGQVWLVGGGPGDPELITVLGRRLLAQADVVVHDRLGPHSLLEELADDVERIDVGKTAGHHPVPQEEINRLLVEHARAGRLVVRLKGGDPFLLGRGGEEVEACRAAGVAVSVVPGVTSAFAAPAAAGIPVTHRGLASQVTVVSGHDEPDWAALARLPGTLVLLMGVARLPGIAEMLLAHGRDPATPVAVVEQATTPDQRTTTGTLTDIAARARAVGVRAPAVIVVGEVVTLATPPGLALASAASASAAPASAAPASVVSVAPPALAAQAHR